MPDLFLPREAMSDLLPFGDPEGHLLPQGVAQQPWNTPVGNWDATAADLNADGLPDLLLHA